MAFTRTTTINSAPGGDSVKQAVLDLDTDLTGAFANANTTQNDLNVHKGLTTNPHSVTYAQTGAAPLAGSSSQDFAAKNLTTSGNTTLGDATTDTLTVGVNGIVKTATSNVLIGTTTDDGVNKLQVNGSIKATSSLYSNGGGGVVFNSCTGLQALYNNTTGSDNTANGYAALYYNTTGSGNAANGRTALFSNTTGANNTANGYAALYYNTTGSGNICIGSRTSAGDYAPVFNCTAENDRVVIGSTSVTNAYVNVAWTIVSDRRDKTNIVDIPVGLDFISQLTPVRYERKLDRDSIEGDGITRYGFIAQDVLAIEGDAPVIVDSENAEHLRINETSIIAVLVKAVQELNAKLDAHIQGA